MSNDLEIYNKILLKDNVKRTFEAEFVKSLFKKYTCPQSDIIQFLHQAQLTGANPVLNQIYLVERNAKVDGGYAKKGTVVYSYNFLLAVAAETGEFEGYKSEMKVEKRFNPITGKWGDEELSYTVTVKRKNKGEYPYTAYWSEYVQKDFKGVVNSQWASKPHVMLEKCAVSGALRRAFPESLSGMFIEDELSDDEISRDLSREEKEKAIEIKNQAIEEKKEILKDKIENEDERDATISIIKDALGVLTSHMTKIEEKGKALVDFCGVRKFDDLKAKTLDELKAISSKLNDLQKEQLLRESAKAKTAKNASFKLENP